MAQEKPPPPINHEKLPLTYLVSIVPVPGKESKAHAVVLIEMQGDQVKRRKVVSTEPDLQLAMDEYNRVGTRIFYFGRVTDEWEK